MKKKISILTNDLQSIDNEFACGATPVTPEESKVQEEYNRALEDINATLRKNRKQYNCKDEKKIHREGSKSTLDSKKSDSKINIEGMKRSTSRPTIDQCQARNKKSSSKSTLDPG